MLNFNRFRRFRHVPVFREGGFQHRNTQLGPMMQFNSQLEAAFQVALKTKLAKTVCDGLCAYPSSLEKGHRGIIETLIHVIGIENLPDQSYLLGVFLGLNPDIDVIIPGCVEQLAYGDFAGADSSELWL